MRSRLVFWGYLSGRPGSRGSEGLFGGSNGRTKLRKTAAHGGSRWARLGLKEQQQGKVQGHREVCQGVDGVQGAQRRSTHGLIDLTD